MSQGLAFPSGVLSADASRAWSLGSTRRSWYSSQRSWDVNWFPKRSAISLVFFKVMLGGSWLYPWHGANRKNRFQYFLHCRVKCSLQWKRVHRPFLRNCCFYVFTIPVFHLPCHNLIWNTGLQILKLLIKKCSPSSCYFFFFSFVMNFLT
jgi:hypothetical protein